MPRYARRLEILRDRGGLEAISDKEFVERTVSVNGRCQKSMFLSHWFLLVPLGLEREDLSNLYYETGKILRQSGDSYYKSTKTQRNDGTSIILKESFDKLLSKETYFIEHSRVHNNYYGI